MGVREMPKVMTTLRLDLANYIGPFFFVMGFLLPFPGIVVALVYEKEHKLRVMMKMMGLDTSAYWAINYVFFSVIYMMYITIFVLVGTLADLSFFTKNEWSIQFTFFFLFVHQTVAFAFLWSILIARQRTANIASHLFLISGAIMGITLIDAFLSTSITSASTLTLISLVPPFLLYRGCFELAYYATNGVYMGIEGMSWEDMTTDPRNGMNDLMLIMVLEWALFLALTLYLDTVLDTGVGIPRHPLFCLEDVLPKSVMEWFGSTEKVDSECPEEDKTPASREDVKAEEERVEALLPAVPDDAAEEARIANGGEDSILVRGLRMVYPATNGNPPKVANKSVTMSVKHGECMGMLGPNGAGKTTCIKMLCGFESPTAGYATVEGLNIITKMKLIYTLMGVCPQDNHIWGSLTAREHLLFYGRLKNLEADGLEEAISEALASVNLLPNIDDQAETFSGGMKRRLSVAISMIGDPLVCYLDEPSTGLDPASRRVLWKCIKEAKKSRSILLTTHSMEEAEALCDRLGIFIDGALHCLGPPKTLTERYGGTYVMSVSSLPGNEGRVAELVASFAPSMKITHSVAGTQVFEMPTAEVTLSTIFGTMLSSRDELSIRDWGVANTTLEEAFIKIAKAANAAETF